MSSIKPKHFDILVFVFVSPNGITYKIMNQKSFMQHFATRFACRKEGYSVPFSVHCRNRYEQRKRYVLDFTSNNVMALCA